MNALIKDFYSSDVPNLYAWDPVVREEIYFPLQLTIGLPEDEGGHTFQVMVATPEAVRKHVFDISSEGQMLLGKYLIVSDYSWKDILDTLNHVVESCEGRSWDDIVGKLSKIFWWEFEDYKE